MDSIKSFKGYGKVDEIEQQAFQKKTRKRIIILVVSCVVLAAVIIAAVAGVVIHKRNSSSSSDNSVPPTEITPAASVKAVCDVTQYPNSCLSSISSLPNSNTTDPEILFKLSLRVAVDELSKLSKYPSKLKANVKDPRVQKAIDVCGTVFDDAVDRLNESISSLEVGGGGGKVLSPAKISDIETWLSSTMTYQDTCLDALEELNSTAANELIQDLKIAMKNSTEFASNSLAIVTKILGLLSNFNNPIHRRLLGFAGSESGFPDWVGPAERRLLQDTNKTTPDAVVARDGSGQYKTIKEALATVKKKSVKRFVIYVKEGTYVENIDLDKNTWNVVIYGDGKTKTIISGSRNFMDGTPTFETATFAVKGKGFIAKDIGFQNTAGASKHQAVALRSGSDQSVFFRCSFDGYQDTLYAHSNRQFYSECDITGTIDFIFGNAAVVFQNCIIKPRQPLPNQFNTITAQGKKDPNQNTGIIIQKSSISAPDNLTARTYLGRPWKEYSTTVIMLSDIGSFLNPVGWIEWVPNVEPASTIFYAEYQNSGPGSDVAQRVKWAGYKSSLSEEEAVKFTVQSFIRGTGILEQLTTINIGEEERKATIRDMMTADDQWDKEKFMGLLPVRIVNIILNTRCPSDEKGKDQLIWRHSTDGSFSIKSAYEAREDNNLNHSSIWRKIWKWRGPQKIRTFLWLMSHNSIITNHFRYTRHLVDSGLYTLCGREQETVLHCMRDCSYVKNL